MEQLSRHRDLDYRPLTARIPVGERLRAVSTSNLTVMGVTVAVLLVVVPAVIAVALVATGNATDVGGLAVLGLCFAGGVYTLVDVVRRAGEGGALRAFARVNELELVGGSTVTDYAGSLFQEGSHAVHQAVRTRDAAFVEVGDRFPTRAASRQRGPNRREVYLRARLGGRVPRVAGVAALLTPERHGALSRFAGEHAVEVSGDELTVFGRRSLDATVPGRVETAVTLADALVARADRVYGLREGGSVDLGKRPGTAPGRRPRPLAVVGWTLALVVVVPIAFAVVMSILDDGLRGNRLGAGIVVSVLVTAVGVVVARLGRAALTPRRGGGRRHEG